MKYLLAIFILPLIACITDKGGYEVPSKWNKDFKITLYEGGGMAYESLDVTYTADSCIYDRMEQGVHSVSAFKLTEQNKTDILKKLMEFKLNKVRSKENKGTVYDKSSTRLCLINGANQTCMESGATVDITANSEGFYKAYTYLTDFASKKQH